MKGYCTDLEVEGNDTQNTHHQKHAFLLLIYTGVSVHLVEVNDNLPLPKLGPPL